MLLFKYFYSKIITCYHLGDAICSLSFTVLLSLYEIACPAWIYFYPPRWKRKTFSCCDNIPHQTHQKHDCTRQGLLFSKFFRCCWCCSVVLVIILSLIRNVTSFMHGSLVVDDPSNHSFVTFCSWCTINLTSLWYNHHHTMIDMRKNQGQWYDE